MEASSTTGPSPPGTPIPQIDGLACRKSGVFPRLDEELSPSPLLVHETTMWVSVRQTPRNDEEASVMMVKCTRCGLAYSHSRSTSALVLTYCCMLCEVADLGYSLAAFEKAPVAEIRPAVHPTASRAECSGLFIPLAA